MSKIHREKVTLESGEAYVVAPDNVWHHVIAMYESQSVHPDDEWAQMADHFREWFESTVYYASSEDDYDW